MISILELVIACFFFLGIEGFFSASELALFSADRSVLKKKAREGNRGCQEALELILEPQKILSTTLFFKMLCVIGLSNLVHLYCKSLDLPYQDLIAIIASSFLIIFFGELLPKSVYQKHAVQLAPRVARVIRFFYRLCYPITKILDFYMKKLSKGVGSLEHLVIGANRTTRDELQSMFTPEQAKLSLMHQMIKKSLEFRESQAQHAQIPLVQVVGLEIQSTVQKALEKFKITHHSRLPVFLERVDSIVGILEASDLLAATDMNQSISSLMKPAQFVAEKQPLSDVLIKMEQEKSQMVVVVDEYGGAVGILTFEDIAEEVVGEISDEYDDESKLVTETHQNQWFLQGRIKIDQMNELLDLTLPSGDYETLAGFLLSQFEKIPSPGEELIFESGKNRLKFIVSSANERQIETVFVQKLSEEEEKKGKIV